MIDNMQKNLMIQRRTLNGNMEVLNSDRSQPMFLNMQSILTEKEIPDEGNARRPVRHQTKANDFKGN